MIGLAKESSAFKIVQSALQFVRKAIFAFFRQTNKACRATTYQRSWMMSHYYSIIGTGLLFEINDTKNKDQDQDQGTTSAVSVS